MQFAIGPIAFLLMSFGVARSQLTYTDRGHWVGVRGCAHPSPVEYGFVLMYEYRFDKYWSGLSDVTGMRFRNGFAYLLAGAMRMRIPVARYSNKNIYAQCGFGSGSKYPVLHYAVGFEFAITEPVALFAQYRKFSPNFDHLKPSVEMYSLGVTVDLTSTEMRQHFLLPE